MNKNLVIILLTIMSVGLLGYIIYDNFNEKEINNNLNTNNETISYKLEDFTKIINDELDFLIGQDNLNDLTNEEKTYMIYSLLDDKTNITTEMLENIRKNSSLREMEIEYTDIYDSYTSYKLADEIARSLDKKTGQYSENLSGHGGIAIGNNSFLVDFKQENGKYILSYKYVFTKAQGSGPTDIDMYFTYKDASNDENKIKEFLIKDASYNYQELKWKVDTYISENYENIKDKLETYNYVFEVKDEAIILTDFSKN